MIVISGTFVSIVRATALPVPAWWVVRVVLMIGC
jgi:hypothetical protein